MRSTDSNGEISHGSVRQLASSVETPLGSNRSFVVTLSPLSPTNLFPWGCLVKIWIKLIKSTPPQ